MDNLYFKNNKNRFYKTLIFLLASLSPFVSGIVNNSRIVLQQANKDSIIVDCSYTLNEALANKYIPGYIRKDLRIVDVYYYSFDNKLHRGQIVINKKLVEEIKKIFNELMTAKFPIKKAVPVVFYNWSDIASMKDNNTSCFNYRHVAGTKYLSPHALGTAIDINPELNPQIRNGRVIPPGAKYNPHRPGTITRNGIVVKIFRKFGWQWGGTWTTTTDYQHFQKN